jgi:ATP-dependent Clp protease ATP-binding subunit ClpA
MFERFTHAARAAVVGAQAEASDLQQSPVGTQHVLLAMVADDSGPIASLLRGYGIDEVYVRDEIIRRVGTAASDTDPLPDADAEDAAALKAIGIDLDAVRRAIEENFGPGSLRLPRDTEPMRRGLLGRFSGGGRRFSSVGHRPFSPRSKKVLELSLREALSLKHNFIAPEHIMLGIVRDGQGMAAQILAGAGVDFARLRADLIRSLNENAA